MNEARIIALATERGRVARRPENRAMKKAKPLAKSVVPAAKKSAHAARSPKLRSPASARRAVASGIYSVHPSFEMLADWIAGLPQKTGRSLPEWVAFIEKSGPAGETARREWLKSAHGLGTNTAWWLAERSVGKGGEEDTPEGYLSAAEGYVADMFAGPKAGLVPIYDALLALGRALAKDVKFCPCKTIVPFYRRHVIAQVKPSTRTRIDFGLALGGMPATGRLIETGGFAKKDRITHKIEITHPSEVDAEVRRWLQTAYDRDV
jgi:hypothetical protein